MALRAEVATTFCRRMAGADHWLPSASRQRRTTVHESAMSGQACYRRTSKACTSSSEPGCKMLVWRSWFTGDEHKAAMRVAFVRYMYVSVDLALLLLCGHILFSVTQV